VADQVVRGLAQRFADQHGTGDPVEWIGVRALDTRDQVVEPGRSSHAEGLRHASTLS
jgi:hypothetical protein